MITTGISVYSTRHLEGKMNWFRVCTRSYQWKKCLKCCNCYFFTVRITDNRSYHIPNTKLLISLTFSFMVIEKKLMNISKASCKTVVYPVCWQWASCQKGKIAGCACAGNAGNDFHRHRLRRKPLVSDPSMHHGTCVTHVPWCMSGSLTHGGGENAPGIPVACASAILRIW